MACITIKPCDSCGKELVWGLARWPIESEPRPYFLSQKSRAYVFVRSGPRRASTIDVRDVPDPPDRVYPQHVCRVWQEQRERIELEASRADRIMERLLG